MSKQKVYYIANDNMILDTIVDKGIGTEQIVATTLDYIQKDRDSEWLEPYIVEIEADGSFDETKLNAITTIKLNNKPFRTIINQLVRLPEIVESYKNDEYRKYTFSTEFIQGDRV